MKLYSKRRRLKIKQILEEKEVTPEYDSEASGATPD
jgi:hypothetical protein